MHDPVTPRRHIACITHCYYSTGWVYHVTCNTVTWARQCFMVCIRPDGEPEGTLRVDEGSDSSEDERPPRNTVGEVPLQWYNGEEHIGYDHDAKKLIKRTRKDKLETLLAQTDTKQGLRTIYDEYNDEEIVLSKDELRMIQRIRQGQFPDVEVLVLDYVSELPTDT